MLRLVLFLIYLALVVYALVDVIQADEDEVGGAQKGFWIIAIIFLPLAGSIAWIVVSNAARRRRAASRDQVTGFPEGQPPPAQYSRRVRSWERDVAPPAPEDDPEFLWLMEQARRKRARESPESGRRDSLQPEDDERRESSEDA